MPALPLFRLPGVTEPTKRCPVESRSVLTDNSVGLGVLWVTGYTLLPTTRLALSAPFKLTSWHSAGATSLSRSNGGRCTAVAYVILCAVTVFALVLLYLALGWW